MLRFRALLLASGGLVTACSLVNAYDEVVPSRGGDGADATADANDAAPEDDVFVPKDSGPGADALDSGPPKGAIVVGGVLNEDDGGVTPVLTALGPEDGTELPRARERMNVAAAAYDGLRDLWYVFESGGAGFYPTPSDPVWLHTRQLDTYTGAWTELEKIPVPPLVSFTSIAVLRNRMVFVAYDAEAGAGARKLVAIDTTNPADVVIYDEQALSIAPIGGIATRLTSGIGGSVNLLSSASCDGGSTRCLEITHVTVSNGVPPNISPPSPLGPFAGSPAYGSFLTGGVDVIATRASFASQTTTLATYAPLQYPPQQVGTPTTFNIIGPFLKPLAFAECLQQALLVETNQDLSVYAVPMTSGGRIESKFTGHSGQGVYFEPYTSTVLTPFSQGSNFELTAFTLAGTAAAPTLTRRNTPGWSPPAKLRPNLVATRTPIPFTCK